MSYIKFAKYLPAAFAMVAGCAGAPATQTRGETRDDVTTAAVADQEIELFRRAITSLNNAELDRARTDFQQLARSRPALAGPWINLALIDIKKNDFAAAETHLAKALERNPGMPQAYNMLGFIEVARGNMSKAMEHYQKAVALKQDYALAYYNMGLLHDIYLHDTAKAVQHYKRYLELTNHQDKKTADWVAELERGLARSTP